jgi:hypothetical protein
MHMRHKQDEPVRAYLLGILDDRRAGALEEKYFLDRDFFGEVRDIETKLIHDYFEDRLSGSEKQLFEKRYLETPGLAHRLEEVREDYPSVRPIGPHPRSTVRRWSFAVATLSLLLIGGLAYWRARQLQADGGGGQTRIAHTLSVITVRLTPGLIKGAGTQSVTLAPPSAETVVRLLLELPGQNLTADYQARLMTIGADGHLTKIWTSGTLRSTTARGGGVLTVDVSANILQPGDYLVEAGRAERDTLEAYLFRVSAVP